MTEPSVSGLRAEHIYPALTPAQVARIAAHGKPRRIAAGEVLIQAGERTDRFFVVVTGGIDIVRTSGSNEELVVAFTAGMFSGEATLLSGGRSLVQIRAGAP